MSQKRNRSINWDEGEKHLLRSVLKDFAHIIENKSLDTNTSKSKAKAWEDVTKQFNQLNSRPRDLSQLKLQWKAMKMNARKTVGNYKKEVHKTGGGPRPASPDVAILEIKDLLNPAELIRDDNEFDSDGVQFTSTSGTNKQENKDKLLPMLPSSSNDLETCVIENQEVANICIETNEDNDAQLAVQQCTPLVVSQDHAEPGTSVQKMDPLPVQISEDVIVVTPATSRMRIIPGKKAPKRKIVNNIGNNKSLKPKKDQADYVNTMINHSKLLKDEEHMRCMEMAEEEHSIKMEIHREKLKSAILEREILELKKKREELL